MAPYDLVLEWYRYMSVEERFAEDSTFIRRFMEVVQKAEEMKIRSLNKFLEFWAAEGAEEKTPMPAHMDAVRIMTIHKAKGLQAPVTIVPKTNFIIKPNAKNDLIDMGDMQVPVRAGLKEAGQIYELNWLSQTQEALNVLYVAFTRACDELYVFVTSTTSKKSSFKYLDPAIDYLLKKANYKLPLTIGSPYSGKRQSDNADSTPAEAPVIEPLPEKWKPMAWQPHLKVYHTYAPIDKLTPDRRGTFLHFCMENMKFDGEPANDAEDALNFGVAYSPIAVPGHLRKDLLKPLTWFRSLPQASDWLKNGIPEQTMFDEKGDELRTDLLIPVDNGFLIIDYKTGHDSPEYVDQIRNYISCLEKVYPDKNITGILVYLDLQTFKKVTSTDCSGMIANL